MNVYIAGVAFDRVFRELPKISCDKLIKIIPEIVNEAKQELGENVITIIVLHEYAFMMKPINYALKQELLKKLYGTVRQFENLILIPGSFSVYRELVNAPYKKKRIENNYYQSQQFFRTCPEFRHEYTNFLSKENQPLYENMYMENCTYLLTDRNKIKHKKSYLSAERITLSPVNQDRSIFYMGNIGVDKPLKIVDLGNQLIDVAVLICREHFIDAEIREKVEVKLPLIEVIISDWIRPGDVEKEAMRGALNIYMDSKNGLVVYFNTSHEKAHEINEVRAIYIKMNKCKIEQKKDIPVTPLNQVLLVNKM